MDIGGSSNSSPTKAEAGDWAGPKSVHGPHRVTRQAHASLTLSVSVSVSVSYIHSLLCSHRRRTEHAPFHHLTETQNALSPLPTTRTPALVPRHARRRPRRRHSRELPAPTLQNHQPQIQRRHLAMVGVTGWTQQHRRHRQHCHPPHEPSRHAVLS